MQEWPVGCNKELVLRVDCTYNSSYLYSMTLDEWLGMG